MEYQPVFSISACGKNYYQDLSYVSKKEDYQASYEEAIKPIDNKKLEMLKTIIKFQYELQRDWGFLSILGLPVTKMQTEYIGGLYSTKNNEVLDKLNESIKEDSSGTHMIMSSIPYLFIPGAGTVYKVISENGGKVGALIGGGGTAPTGIGAVFGAIFGGLVGTVTGSAIGMGMAYQVAKTVLAITPIVGIIILGLVRFIIIMIKIFSFHFASLFMMPIMFAKENFQAISRFSVKILATMLELPIFVLSIWLAITANSLVHAIGDIFSKKIIIGMLANNDAGYEGVQGKTWAAGANGEWLAKLKIYVFDGFMEIAISVFAILIIYKLIISLHESIFEVLEIQGTKGLDSALESMKGEANSWGTRV